MAESIPRPELEKLLSTIEGRMDERLARMEKDTDRRAEEFRREMALRDEAFQRELSARQDALKAHIEVNDKAVASALDSLERTRGEFAEVISATKAQKYWLAGIGVAVVLGIMGANATIFSGAKTFFDIGRDDVAKEQQVQEIKSLLEDIKALKAAPPSATPPAPSQP